MRWLNGPNYDYSKLKKEEVIYKGLVCTNIQVLPLHTASPSPHASARKHVMQPEPQNRNNFEVIVGRAHS
jgi:hypothetical protein